jgi:hypothetical protein
LLPEPGASDAPQQPPALRPIPDPDLSAPPVAADKDSVTAASDPAGSSSRAAAPGPDSAETAAARSVPHPQRHARTARPRTLTAAELEDELDQVNLELSVMVIEDPAVWTFDLLRDRIDELSDQATTSAQRSRTRQIANQIARFEDIKRRQAAVLAMRDRAIENGRLAARLPPPDLAPAAGRPQLRTDGRYDGVGRLAELPSTTPGAPHFALTNEAGEVLCYVTAAPGVNLRAYLGRQIGVVGNRGLVPQQQTAHIVARHVTPLDGQNLLR